jgi:hypothetical protein
VTGIDGIAMAAALRKPDPFEAVRRCTTLYDLEADTEEDAAPAGDGEGSAEETRE